MNRYKGLIQKINKNLKDSTPRSVCDFISKYIKPEDSVYLLLMGLLPSEGAEFDHKLIETIRQVPFASKLATFNSVRGVSPKFRDFIVDSIYEDIAPVKFPRSNINISRCLDSLIKIIKYLDSYDIDTELEIHRQFKNTCVFIRSESTMDIEKYGAIIERSQIIFLDEIVNKPSNKPLEAILMASRAIYYGCLGIFGCDEDKYADTFQYIYETCVFGMMQNAFINTLLCYIAISVGPPNEFMLGYDSILEDIYNLVSGYNYFSYLEVSDFDRGCLCHMTELSEGQLISIGTLVDMAKRTFKVSSLDSIEQTRDIMYIIFKRLKSLPTDFCNIFEVTHPYLLAILMEDNRFPEEVRKKSEILMRRLPVDNRLKELCMSLSYEVISRFIKTRPGVIYKNMKRLGIDYDEYISTLIIGYETNTSNDEILSDFQEMFRMMGFDRKMSLGLIESVDDLIISKRVVSEFDISVCKDYITEDVGKISDRTESPKHTAISILLMIGAYLLLYRISLRISNGFIFMGSFIEYYKELMSITDVSKIQTIQ